MSPRKTAKIWKVYCPLIDVLAPVTYKFRWPANSHRVRVELAKALGVKNLPQGTIIWTEE